MEVNMFDSLLRPYWRKKFLDLDGSNRDIGI